MQHDRMFKKIKISKYMNTNKTEKVLLLNFLRDAILLTKYSKKSVLVLFQSEIYFDKEKCLMNNLDKGRKFMTDGVKEHFMYSVTINNQVNSSFCYTSVCVSYNMCTFKTLPTYTASKHYFSVNTRTKYLV